MSRLGVDRKSRSGRHPVDPTGELVAFCNEEPPRLDQRVVMRFGPKSPSEPLSPKWRGPLRHQGSTFRGQPIPTHPPQSPTQARPTLSVSLISTYHSKVRELSVSEGYRSTDAQHRARARRRAPALVPTEPRRFTKSSVGDEIAMSSDRERSVVMNC